MKKIKNVFFITIIISFTFIFSACWDNIDIDRKIFISTIAIDPGKDIGKQKELKKINPSSPFQNGNVKKLNVIFGFPDISKTDSVKGGSVEDQFIKTQAYSLEDAISCATARSSRNIFFGQSKLLILSSEIMQYPDVFREIMDYLQREPKRNRMMYTVISQGNAEQFVDYKAPMEKNIEAYMNGIMQNSSDNSTILPVTLNEVITLLSQNSEAIIPVMQLDKKENQIFLSGVGIIKGYKMIGTLNEVETGDLEILRGKLRGGKKTIYMDGHPLEFFISDANREMVLTGYDKKQKKLHFKINLKIEGTLKEYYLFKNIYNDKIINEVQDNFNKSIGEECSRLIKLTQQEFKVDPIGFRDNIEKYHPYIWDDVKNDWEKVYSDIDVDINVNTFIRRNGVAK